MRPRAMLAVEGSTQQGRANRARLTPSQTQVHVVRATHQLHPGAMRPGSADQVCGCSAAHVPEHDKYQEQGHRSARDIGSSATVGGILKLKSAWHCMSQQRPLQQAPIALQVTERHQLAGAARVAHLLGSPSMQGQLYACIDGRQKKRPASTRRRLSVLHSGEWGRQDTRFV